MLIGDNEAGGIKNDATAGALLLLHAKKSLHARTVYHSHDCRANPLRYLSDRTRRNLLGQRICARQVRLCEVGTERVWWVWYKLPIQESRTNVSSHYGTKQSGQHTDYN